MDQLTIKFCLKVVQEIPDVSFQKEEFDGPFSSTTALALESSVQILVIKLKLTEEKQTAIRDVIQTDLPPNAEGVCVRCFGKVEKVLKYQKEIKDILKTFEENMKRNRAKTPGSSTRKKRGRASPKTHEQVTIHRPAVEHATATCVSETRYRPIMPQPPQTEGSLQGCKSFPDITGHDTLEIAVDVLRTSAEPAKEDFGTYHIFLILFKTK
ncbi:uncharacterized protein LOC134241603 [Saccostrea cucullata]|uniref:uncharacterized protein LOC134241603 n=1 Tax=Saccostrea cuccullata TaxID=36930 RepID=UPI002ED51C37